MGCRCQDCLLLGYAYCCWVTAARCYYIARAHASVLWKMLVALKILIFELRKPQKWILRAILRGTWTPLTTSNNQNWLNEAETRQKALISAPILCTLNQPKLTICPFHIHALPKVSLRLSVWTLHWNSCPHLWRHVSKVCFGVKNAFPPNPLCHFWKYLLVPAKNWAIFMTDKNI